MIILGLHFGHDASITVIKDGKIIVCIERERTSRIRHAIGLTPRDIRQALSAAKISVNEIDYCSITSTQSIEYIFTDPDNLSFKIDYQNLASNTSNWASGYDRNKIESRMSKYVLELVKKREKHPYINRLSEEMKSANSNLLVGSIEDFFIPEKWEIGVKLKHIHKLVLEDPLHHSMSQSMQLPVKLNLFGKNINGWLLSHHFAHAAYAYYTSGFDISAILTQDGSLPGGGYWGGMFYFGLGNNLYPLCPHFLVIGRLYERVSELIGFGTEEGPGKMMGLAPFGKPRLFDYNFVGNLIDWDELSFSTKAQSFNLRYKDTSIDKWIRHCLNTASQIGYDLSAIGDLSRVLDPINVDIAASTQLLLEEIMLIAVNYMKDILKKSNIEKCENLCLSGGTALNCPSNSRIYRSKLFKEIFIPPAVHDGGLSTGSALAVYHNTLQQPLKKFYGLRADLAFLGIENSTSLLKDDLKKYSKYIHFSKTHNVSQSIANRIANNEIVAVVNGRSEIGPRALGHRSILAHPGFKENWGRVNNIKKREHWRPFAPAILEEDLYYWFSGIPQKSPFMLMTAVVIGKKVPAITHVDGSSRVQTVDDSNIFLKSVLTAFKTLTGFPLILNTSFNGPGQPIIETPEQAINFFLTSDIAALYINDYEVIKK